MKKIIVALLLFAVLHDTSGLETNVTKVAISDEKKPLLLFFTGIDWCGWCIQKGFKTYQICYLGKVPVNWIIKKSTYRP
jgi:hypothetical protein